LNPSIRVFCNRGASGIDGSTSTAVGAACAFKGQTVFITGDLSFFYDNNGLWNRYMPVSFRIILINNGGGGIFRILPGPKRSGALDYFETPHSLNAAPLCEMHGIEYLKVCDGDELQAALKDFYQPSKKPRLMEVFTPAAVNDEVLMGYFRAIS
jgi:2-succinyl-5-enolpyruvyl-6-hydroxy-3-cyclohexene-1-carboxylate synthase